MKSWKGLINNNEANELYVLLEKVQNKKATDKEEKRIIDLADLLNNNSFSDEAIEQFIDWKQVNNGLHNAVEVVLN